jgi:hypothetical protein
MKFQCLFFLSALCLSATAQSISGTLIDEESHPLSYVTVSHAKSQTGTYSDDQGHFSLDVQSLAPTDEILFSHIGYAEEKRTVAQLSNDKNPIQLKPKNYSLNEVTVKPFDAKNLLLDALSHIKDNYPAEFTKNHILYKDYSVITGQKNHYNYFDFNMYLPSYLAKDSPRIYTTDIKHEMYEQKGAMFHAQMKPTMLLKIMYPERMFSEKQMADNDFSLSSTTAMIDGEEYDVVHFKRIHQKKDRSITASGNVYINKKDKGIRFIDLHMYNEKPERFFLVAKMDTLNVIAKVAFKKVGDKYMLDYIVQNTYANGKLFGKRQNLVYSTSAKVQDIQTGLKMNEIVMRTEVDDIFTNEKPKDIQELKETPDMK